MICVVCSLSVNFSFYLSIHLSIIFISVSIKRNPCSVEANLLDCNIQVYEFKL